MTKFNGGFKDWLSFWNQFVFETDRSIKIYLKNNLLELVERQPKYEILELPHAFEGHTYAKKSMIRIWKYAKFLNKVGHIIRKF